MDRSAPLITYEDAFARLSDPHVTTPMELDGDIPNPTAEALNRAQQVLEACLSRDIIAPGVFALGAGGVSLEWHAQGFSVELDVRNDSVVGAFWCLNTAHVDEDFPFENRCFESFDPDEIARYVESKGTPEPDDRPVVFVEGAIR